ncbi:FkbM family methyltransferase (plasmid) [Skermanella rosea]|uniref:FkbM family methyltransferase n=1 Tax=Skermanella rosea TaxID=1817965 RepID=UPI001932AAA5|nr:FkbM family methyltransferase [Skermanella rosea]UEM06789.1 FkbM family methyltransferase [Skermanella rosea]
MVKSVLGNLSRKMGVKGRIDWYLTKLNYRRTVSLNGVELRIPAIRGVSCDISEPWMSDLLRKVLRQPGAFLDIGVNVGQTLVKVKSLDPDRDYVGFEPNPVCVAYLQELIRDNAFANCTIVPVGLYTEDGVLALDLFSDSATDSSGSLIENFRPDHKVFSTVLVPVFRYDAVDRFVKSDRVGIVKIDVEGAELEVVKSLYAMIRRDRPIILAELLPVYSERNAARKSRQDELERILSDLGYAILRVEKKADNTYSGLRHLAGIGIHSNLDQCDHVLVPRERLGELPTVLDMVTAGTADCP